MMVRSTGLCRMVVVVAVARLLMDVLVFLDGVVVCVVCGVCADVCRVLW